MLRRVLGVAVVALVLSSPQEASAQSFDWCYSLTSGSCFDFTFSGSDNYSSNWGNHDWGSWQNWLDDVLDDWDDLEDLFDDWYDHDWDWGGHYDGPNHDQPTTSVPEPATWAMLMTGLLGLGAVRRNRGGRD